MQRFLVTLLFCSAAWAQQAVRFTGQPGTLPIDLLAGSGTVTSLTVAGTANQITASGTCTITTTGTCTLSVPNGFILPGTINGLTLTTTTGTFTLTNAKTFTVNNTLTIQATDGTTLVVADPASVTTGNCVEFTKSGNTLTLTDAGAACAAGTGDAAATEAVTYGATPTFTMASNTLDTKTMTLTNNVTNCTIASATVGQTITWVLTASGATRTFACAGITNLGTLSIADTVTCTITANATSSSAAFVKGAISCPNGNQLTFVAGGAAEVTFPTGTYSAVGTAITNTFGAAGTLNMSAATNDEALRVPNVAGAANTSDGAISYDTTNKNLHAGTNGADGIVPIVAATPTNGNCPKWVVSASKVSLSNDACSSGGITFTTPYLVNSGSYYYPGMYSAATLPSAATWGSIGGATTWTAVGDTYTLHTDAPGGNGVNMSVRRDTATLASGDFTVTAFLVGCWNPAMEVVQDSGCGITLYDGTKYVSWGLSGNSSSKGVLSYDYYTNATTIASRNQINGNFYYSTVGLIGFRIAKVSGNLAFYVSLDGGIKWITAASGVSCTAHFASCASLNAGVYANPTWTGAFAETTLVSWLEQ